MSSNFCPCAVPRGTAARARPVPAWVAGLVAALAGAAAGTPSVRFADVVSVNAAALAAFAGVPIARLGLFACTAACVPVPFQVDERDARGRWVLDQGPEPNHDRPPGVLDANDVLLFMAADAGAPARRGQLPGAAAAAEIAVRDPLDGAMHWAYVLAFPGAAPRAARSYVHYDPRSDRVTGAAVTLGFRHGVPGYLALAGVDLLDRFAVRASATFLFGLIHFHRSEDDLRTQFVAWHAGPIRVIRCQRQWVRIGWGIRSPTFGSYTYFYRDFAALPVALYLHVPPAYFFGNIVVRAILEFRDLRGWSLLLPDLPAPIPIDGTMTPHKQALNELPASWFALRGPRVTLVQALRVSPSLASVRLRLVYGEGATADPPEGQPPAEPGVGYRFDHWEHVRAGEHWLQSVSYALPPGLDARAFMRAEQAPLQVLVRPLPSPAPP